MFYHISPDHFHLNKTAANAIFVNYLGKSTTMQVAKAVHSANWLRVV